LWLAVAKLLRYLPDMRARGGANIPRSFCFVMMILLSAAGHGCVIPLPRSGDIPTGTWTSATSNLSTALTACTTLSMLSLKTDEDLLIAGLEEAGLWTSNDGGASWQLLSPGTTIQNRPSSLVYDPMDSNRWWESGIYGTGGGVYETQDDGKTFSRLGSAYHCDLVSVDFSDPKRQTLVVGGHEHAQALNLSIDGGMTWTNISSGLPTLTNCAYPFVIDAKTYLVGCGGFGGGPTGIFRTGDSGATWTKLTASGGGGAPLRASDGVIYWPGAYGQPMARSLDNGLTWTDVAPAFATLGTPIELPDTRLAALGPLTSNEAQYVLVSADQGVTWKPASSPLPVRDLGGVMYSVPRKAFYVWGTACPPDTGTSEVIVRYDFDYKAN
jgi:hypothetical protein